MNVDQLIDEAIGREGDYVNNPKDKGGPTRWGITEQVARAYGYTGDMRVLPLETAVAIYRKRYLIEPGFDKILAMSASVGELLFDTGINMGHVNGHRRFRKSGHLKFPSLAGGFVSVISRDGDRAFPLLAGGRAALARAAGCWTVPCAHARAAGRRAVACDSWSPRSG